jgi:integrase
MANEAARQQTTETLQKLYDGKLRLERRNGGSKIYARTYLQGRSIIHSTGEVTVHAATKIATDWFLDLRDRIRKGEHLHGRSFADVAEAFIVRANQVREVSEGQRQQYQIKWNLLKENFDGVKVTDVDTKFLLALRERLSLKKTQTGGLVKPATLKKDLVFIRLVLRHARNIEKCLDELPEFPAFRGQAWEIVPSPRPFLDHEQWVAVRKLAKARIAEPGLNPRTARQRQELYWFLLISVGAALRVGEAYSLRWQDCTLIKLNDKDRTEALHMRVRGKHSRGGSREAAYGMFGAVSAFKAMQKARPDAKPDDPLFTETHRDSMTELLVAAGLRTNADGKTRNAKSLRQTGISLRLDLAPDPDYRDIAKWARTSPAMIATFHDQTHPQLSVERIVGFRKSTKGSKQDEASTAESE